LNLLYTDCGFLIYADNMNSQTILKKVVTGGQTGTDRALLDIALLLGIEHGGWCPKGRLAEDGIISSRYLLTETPDAAVEQRTEFNARDSDGTLILTFGEPTGGTLFTIECAQAHYRPYFLLDAHLSFDAKSIAKIEEWRAQHSIQILNVAGPRESLSPGLIYRRSHEILKDYLSSIL
jgi:hypothetical protein